MGLKIRKQVKKERKKRREREGRKGEKKKEMKEREESRWLEVFIWAPWRMRVTLKYRTVGSLGLVLHSALIFYLTVAGF